MKRVRECTLEEDVEGLVDPCSFLTFVDDLELVLRSPTNINDTGDSWIEAELRVVGVKHEEHEVYELPITLLCVLGYGCFRGACCTHLVYIHLKGPDRMRARVKPKLNARASHGHGELECAPAIIIEEEACGSNVDDGVLGKIVSCMQVHTE